MMTEVDAFFSHLLPALATDAFSKLSGKETK